MPEHKRKVGERGQVTIPKELRERIGIESGDEVVFVDADGNILIEPPTDEARLAEGYQQRAERSQRLVDEMDDSSTEATEQLGPAPDWDE